MNEAYGPLPYNLEERRRLTRFLAKGDNVWHIIANILNAT